MPEDEFELYLTLLARTLRLSDKQRDAVAAELRDHLEARLDELTAHGHDRHQAIQAALDEFGDLSAFANDLTKTNPARTRHRRHLMQTTFGTIIACAAVTFAVMLLTPSNKDGRPNQPEAVAQDDAPRGGGLDAGGGIEQGDAMGGGRGGLRESEMGGFGAARGGVGRAAQAVPRLELSIQVVDCTDVLRPDRSRGDLLQRTAALASAVQQTVASVNESGERAIRVQPFEEFLIITATESAHEEAEKLLTQIGDRVARRSDIEAMQDQERAALEAKRMRERVQLEMRLQEFNNQMNRLQDEHRQLLVTRAQLIQAHGGEHPRVQEIDAKIADTQSEAEILRDMAAEVEFQLRTAH